MKILGGLLLPKGIDIKELIRIIGITFYNLNFVLKERKV